MEGLRLERAGLYRSDQETRPDFLRESTRIRAGGADKKRKRELRSFSKRLDEGDEEKNVREPAAAVF